MSALWELRCDQKRGTFLVKTYLPNFVLPVHVTSGINRSPSSPTQATAATRPSLRSLEAKLQISLRTKVAEGLVLPDGDLWFA
ncbi:MAG: phospholipase A, partial [Caldimonas sp.]